MWRPGYDRRWLGARDFEFYLDRKWISVKRARWQAFSSRFGAGMVRPTLCGCTSYWLPH